MILLNYRCLKESTHIFCKRRTNWAPMQRLHLGECNQVTFVTVLYRWSANTSHTVASSRFWGLRLSFKVTLRGNNGIECPHNVNQTNMDQRVCRPRPQHAAWSRSSHRRGNADNRNQLLAKIRWEQLIHTTLNLLQHLFSSSASHLPSLSEVEQINSWRYTTNRHMDKILVI